MCYDVFRKTLYSLVVLDAYHGLVVVTYTKISQLSWEFYMFLTDGRGLSELANDHGDGRVETTPVDNKHVGSERVHQLIGIKDPYSGCKFTSPGQ
jgi:hypothetical protein